MNVCMLCVSNPFHSNVHFALLSYNRVNLFLSHLLPVSFVIRCFCCCWYLNQINSTCGVPHQHTHTRALSNLFSLSVYFFLCLCRCKRHIQKVILVFIYITFIYMHTRTHIKTKQINLYVFNLSQGIYRWMPEVSAKTTIRYTIWNQGVMDISIRDDAVYSHHWK